jgi:hypothetical protein
MVSFDILHTMKPIFALLPTNEIAQKIFKLRNELIKKGWGFESERTQVLPHLSVAYLMEINDHIVIDKLESDLIVHLPKFEVITLDVVGVRTWSNKITLMFDNKPARELVSRLEMLLSKYSLSDSQNYLNQLNKSEAGLGEKTYSSFEEASGDHIKIARNIKDEHLNEAVDYTSEFLPKKFAFNKLVFIDYGCTEKDIIWQLEASLRF